MKSAFASFILATALFWTAVSSVHASDEVASQIEKDVWIPFMAAASSFDAEGFLAVQSRDLIRVASDDNEIYGLERYAREIREGFPRAKAKGVKRQSEMRLLSHASSGDLAYQTGYFRSRATLASGEERIRYSRFEFILRREDGAWKILLDKDTAQGGSITEAMFLEAKPMARPADEADGKADKK